MKEQIYTVKVNEDGEFWYKDPECEILHRDNGPAEILSNGYKAYYKNGQLHRDEGPAIIWSDGDKEYFKNGQLHNDNGPAIIWSNGDKEYWLNGGKYSEEEYWKIVGQKSCDEKIFEDTETGKKYKLVEVTE